MRKLFSIGLVTIGLLLAGLPCTAQGVSNNNEEGVYRASKGMPLYVEGEVIVKFTDNENVGIRKNAKGKFLSASVSKVNAKLQEIGTFEMEQLMPLTGAKVTRGARKAISSQRMIQDVDLSQLYVVRFDKEKMSVEEAVEQLKSLENVEYAEPNSIVTICAMDDGTPAFDDPLYAQQWSIPAINLPQLWGMPKVETRRPVIAILDTGVDITHPDLKDNIWTNEAEASGAEFADDDNNGYYDDLHGYDFVANTAIIKNGMDKNGHGTHCAGIAAACGNNGIGIVGANPDAWILPIKVMGDDGTGNAATIIKGIDYAIAAGADVLSMSIGSNTNFCESALQKAYAKNMVLIGAAGNNGLSIYVRGDISGLNFPGALDFVIGVMASNETGARASFTNFDPDGPFFSKDKEFWSYNVMAPGTNIVSTYPGGKYKVLQGTSMSTPLVAGVLSRALQTSGYEYGRSYDLIGDVSMSKIEGTDVFDAYKLLSWNDETRKTALRFVSVEIDDSEGDGDGRIDAGETIYLYPSIRCLWGHAENVRVAVRVDNENVSENAVEILQGEADFGWELNAQGMSRSKNPLKIKVNKNVNDNYNLPLYFSIACDNEVDEETLKEEEISYFVENCVELKGILSSDLTLTPDKNYVITGNFGIPDGVTLTVLPGTKITRRSGSVNVAGALYCIGEPGNMIVFEGARIAGNNYPLTYENAKTKFSYTYFTGSYSMTDISDASFYDCVFDGSTEIWYGNAERTTFQNCVVELLYPTSSYTELNHCNIIGNYRGIEWKRGMPTACNVFGNNSYDIYVNDAGIRTLSNTNYLGTAKEDIARYGVYDAVHPVSPSGFTKLDLSDMPQKPYSEAHGIVWKVVVNGKDAQDEFEELPPLGVGKHRFDVYFNRPMNKAVAPTITMGVREPYSQIEIAEDGEDAGWNDAGDIYTAYLTITGKTSADGLNRIRVIGAEDNEYFEIPEEKYRFNVMVQKAGSMSTGLMAEAGLGKVKLTWETEEEDFADLMGYNVYRFTENSNDTIKVNDMLIDASETELTDYDVTPGTTYYYLVREIGTDLQQHDVSNVVAATPLTAQRGDANGSMSVDIADVVTEVAYLTFQDPQPFIFEAADVNSDNEVDILDVVGTIGIIMEPDETGTMSVDNTPATYSIENGIVYVETPVTLGGVQVMIRQQTMDNGPKSVEVEVLDGLDGFEQMSAWKNDSEMMFLAYSMSGKTLTPGKHAILKLGEDADVENMILSNAKGQNVLAINGTATSISELPHGIDQWQGATVRYFDLMGRQISREAALQRGISIQSIFVGDKCVKSYKLLNK